MNMDVILRTFVKAVYDSGLTLTEISRRSGVAINTMSAWMNGRATPRVAVMADVLDALGYDFQIVKRDPPAQE